MTSTVTSIRIEEDLLQEIKDSGIGNMSKYISNLIKKDLRGVEKVGKQESQRVQKLIDQLDDVEQEWFKYVEKTEGVKVPAHIAGRRQLIDEKDETY